MKMRNRLAVLSLLVWSLPLAGAALAQTAAPTWREALLVPGNLAELEGAVSDIRRLLAAIDKADPGAGWVTNGKDDYQAKLNGELGDLLDVFTGTAYQDARGQLVQADAAMVQGQDRLDRLKNDLRLAPAGNGHLTLADRAMLRDAASGSENAIKAEIAAVTATVAKAKQARLGIIADFTKLMNDRFGAALTEDQATALLYQVNGASIVQSRIVFETIAALEQFLRDGLDATSSPVALQQYYGVAAASRLILVRMYQIHLDQYDSRWLPRLAEMQAENEALMQSTQLSMTEAKTDLQRSQLQNNLALQKTTGAAIDVYETTLQSRRAATSRGLEMAQSEAVVSVNTLRTLEGVFTLSAEMLSNTSEYKALLDLGAPDLLPLDGEALDQTYIALNEKLNQS